MCPHKGMVFVEKKDNRKGLLPTESGLVKLTMIEPGKIIFKRSWSWLMMPPPCRIHQMLLWILHWGARPSIPPSFNFFSFALSLIQCFTVDILCVSLLWFLLDLLPSQICSLIYKYAPQFTWVQGKNLQSVKLPFFANLLPTLWSLSYIASFHSTRILVLLFTHPTIRSPFCLL